MNLNREKQLEAVRSLKSAAIYNAMPPIPALGDQEDKGQTEASDLSNMSKDDAMIIGAAFLTLDFGHLRASIVGLKSND